MNDTLTIDPRPNGPLLVSGTLGLVNSKGQRVATEARYLLCRCGGSAHKPFCDSSHKTNGFSSARLDGGAATGSVRAYAGKQLTIHDQRSVCAHAGHCTQHAPKVFRMKDKPWIDPDGDALDHTVATIRMCPSGALAYSVDGQRQAPPARAAAIHITKDGPYAVVGAAQLMGDATPATQEHYTLCRCGHSANKPFCDGAHGKAGFKDEEN